MIAYPALAGTGMYNCLTVEPVLKDQPIGYKNVVSQKQVVFGDRFSYIET